MAADATFRLPATTALVLPLAVLPMPERTADERPDASPAWPPATTADSPDALLETLLMEPGARFGQGEWIWTLTADEADPDLIDQLDPDPGNDWNLEVEFIILIPVILEVGML